MHRVSAKYWVRIWGLGIVMAAMVVAGTMSGSCAFDTRTTFCEQIDLRCKEGQTCAANQPICIDIGGCGDGIVNPEKGEVCDDGNILDGSETDGGFVKDGCSADCKSNQACGNGILDIGEICDNGSRNGMPADSCDVECRLKAQFCGNGVVDQMEETCDPGGMDTADCNSNLADDIAPGLGCRAPKCGDGYTNMAAMEQCDNKDQITTMDCNGPLCTLPTCGDHFTNDAAGEECDRGGDTQVCNGNSIGDPLAPNNADSNCRIPACGDGYANPNFMPPGATSPEQCDTSGDTQICNGNNNGSNGIGSCRVPRCGDGYRNPNFNPPGTTRTDQTEECDTSGDSQDCNGDNNGSNGIGSCRVPKCGDGYANPNFMPPGATSPEECDTSGDTQTCNGDNNGSNGVGSCRAPSCGDGYKNPNFKPPGATQTEECDTGNDSQQCNGDNGGLNGIGSCRAPSCGDGYVNSAFTPSGTSTPEQCDIGDAVKGIPAVPCSQSGKICTSKCNCN